MGSRLGRRTFLGALAAAGTTVSGIALFGWRSRTARADALVRLASELGESEDVRRLGLAYLHRRPEHADIDWLTAALAPTSTWTSWVQGTERLETDLRAAINADFADGRTVALDGWVLAETELRLCALAALRSPTGLSPDALGVLEKRVVRYETLARELSEAPSDDDGVVFELALTVVLDRVYRPTRLDATLAGGHDYGVLYFKDGTEIGRQLVQSFEGGEAFTHHTVEVPEPGSEIDAIQILPWRGRYPYRLGHLTIVE